MKDFVPLRSSLACLRKKLVRKQFSIRAGFHSRRRRNQLMLGFSPHASIPRTSSFFLLLVAGLVACHSYHIAIAVRNSTGGPISLLEVDYPSASFGADALASGGDFHHLIQTRGSAPLKVQYTVANGRQIQITGPTLFEKQEGKIEVVLLPDGKAEFRPSLNP